MVVKKIIIIPLCFIGLAILINTFRSHTTHLDFKCTQQTNLTLSINVKTNDLAWKLAHLKVYGEPIAINVKGPNDKTKLFMVICGVPSAIDCTKHDHMESHADMNKYLVALIEHLDLFIIEVIFPMATISTCS
jgi:hypothetical protein